MTGVQTCALPIYLVTCWITLVVKRGLLALWIAVAVFWLVQAMPPVGSQITWARGNAALIAVLVIVLAGYGCRRSLANKSLLRLQLEPA